MEITGTFKYNEDSSIDLPFGEDKKPTRFVKEADLLAVKGGAETKSNEWAVKEASMNTQLAEANRLREEAHSNLVKAQAEMEQLKSSYNDYDTLKTKVGELETANGTLKESVGKFEKELAERISANLISNHGANLEAIKDKPLDQLRTIEDAAKVFGKNGNVRRPANYDGGSGGNAGGGPETNLDRAKRIIAENEARHGRSIQVSNANAS